MNLLQMSFFASVIMIAIVIIRSLALHKLPKKIFIVLWYIALIRLLIPFEIASPLSVYSLVNEDESIIERIIPIATPSVLAPESTTLPVLVAETSAYQALPTETVSVVSEKVNLGQLFTIIWLMGMIVCTLFFLVAYIHYYRKFRLSFPVKNTFVNSWREGHKLHRAIAIRQSSCVLSPLTYGIFRPVILMPKKMDWQDTKSLQYILEHEYIHIKRFDAITKMLFALAICIHWFNPLVWLMYILVNRDIELSCDEEVIRSLGEVNKSAYAHTLINMEERANSLLPLYNNFSKNAIEERITAIMKIKKISLVRMIISILLVAGVVTAFATTAENLPEQSAVDLPLIVESTQVLPATELVVATTFKIGDRGPSGGLVFYIDGKMFECSDLLGDANWDDSVALAANYKGGGHDDWYLPTYEELTYVYENLYTEGFIKGVDSYWTSSELDICAENMCQTGYGWECDPDSGCLCETRGFDDEEPPADECPCEDDCTCQIHWNHAYLQTFSNGGTFWDGLVHMDGKADVFSVRAIRAL